MRGFECNALDDLLTPVVPTRLADSLRRLPLPMARRAGEEDSVFLRGSTVTKFVPWKEVRRIESQGNYTVVFLAAGSSTVILRAQIQRAEIREIRLTAGSARELILADGVALPIGRTYWPSLQKFMDSP